LEGTGFSGNGRVVTTHNRHAYRMTNVFELSNILLLSSMISPELSRLSEGAPRAPPGGRPGKADLEKTPLQSPYQKIEDGPPPGKFIRLYYIPACVLGCLLTSFTKTVLIGASEALTSSYISILSYILMIK